MRGEVRWHAARAKVANLAGRQTRWLPGRKRARRRSGPRPFRGVMKEFTVRRQIVSLLRGERVRRRPHAH